ncbi:hypothetical protein J6590_003962 [Homalodisca vitripennis]|nr:hypothetical protein J6590_003962 [Homalodisca vitripennis]
MRRMQTKNVNIAPLNNCIQEPVVGTGLRPPSTSMPVSDERGPVITTSFHLFCVQADAQTVAPPLPPRTQAQTPVRQVSVLFPPVLFVLMVAVFLQNWRIHVTISQVIHHRGSLVRAKFIHIVEGLT